jgi:hypothetical protein
MNFSKSDEEDFHGFGAGGGFGGAAGLGGICLRRLNTATAPCLLGAHPPQM